MNSEFGKLFFLTLTGLVLRLRGVVRVDDGAKLHSDSGVADTLRLRVGPVLANLQGLLRNVLALRKILGMRCLVKIFA